MLVAALTLLVAQAPTPLGVAVTAPAKDRALAARLEHRTVALLKSDTRFLPVVLPTGARFDEAASLAKLQEGREAFLFLEPDRARPLLEEATGELFMAFDVLEDRELALDGMAQRAAILLQLGDRRGAVALFDEILNLAPQYDAEGVEDVGDAALELQRAVRAKRKRVKKGRIVVAAPKKGPFPEVWVDGHRVGVTPVEVRVPIGPHVVAMRGPGIERVARRVAVKPRKPVRLSVPALTRTAEGERFYDLVERVSLARAGYQEAMGEAAQILGGPPEILFITLSPRDKGLLARARRVRPSDRFILGSAEAPVESDGNDLDDALLFLLEEALLGERTAGDDASGQASGAAARGPQVEPGSVVLSAPGRGPAAQPPAPTSADAPADASTSTEEPASPGPTPAGASSPGAASPRAEGAPVIAAAGKAAAGDQAEITEAEEASPVMWAGVGVASGAGAAILVGVVAGTSATLVVFGPTWLNTALAPAPAGPEADAHARATRFVVLGY